MMVVKSSTLTHLGETTDVWCLCQRWKYWKCTALIKTIYNIYYSEPWRLAEGEAQRDLIQMVLMADDIIRFEVGTSPSHFLERNIGSFVYFWARISRRVGGSILSLTIMLLVEKTVCRPVWPGERGSRCRGCVGTTLAEAGVLQCRVAGSSSSSIEFPTSTPWRISGYSSFIEFPSSTRKTLCFNLPLS